MAESQSLQSLIHELELLINLSSNHVQLSKKRINVAKSVINMPSRQFSTRNESEQPIDSLHNVLDEQTQMSFLEEDDLLEEEIKRILQIAENVRDKAVVKQSHKSKVSPFAENNVTRVNKGPVSRCGLTSAGVKNLKKTHAKSHLRTTYQKDFTLAKSNSMPSLCSTSKKSDVVKCGTLERKSYIQAKNMDPSNSKSIGQCAPRINKDYIKINKQNLSLKKKEIPRVTSKNVSEFPLRLLQSSEVNELLACEELGLKSQLPNHREILMVLQEIYNFSIGSNRKAGKKEILLKEHFIERCNSSVTKCHSDSDLQGILNILLPYCGWVYKKNEIKTAKDLSEIKDAIAKSEEKMHSILCSFNLNFRNEHDDQPICSSAISIQNYSELQENLNFKDSLFWHPLVMSSVFQGMEMPPFVYYKNVHEWISLQNAVLELHQYYIQLKVLKSIHPIITEVLGLVDSEDSTPDGDWMKSLAQLLKATAILADFTGHLTLPILASIKSDTSSHDIHC